MVPGVEGGVTVHVPSGERMAIYDAAERYRADGDAARRGRGQGVRQRLLARLGGEGHAAARRARGHRRELRAHPPLEPGRHGRAAAAVQGRARTRSRSGSPASERSRSAASARGLAPRQDVTVEVERRRTARRGSLRRGCAPRHARRHPLLRERRHPADRAAQDAEGLTRAGRLTGVWRRLASSVRRRRSRDRSTWSRPAGERLLVDSGCSRARRRCGCATGRSPAVRPAHDSSARAHPHPPRPHRARCRGS